MLCVIFTFKLMTVKISSVSCKPRNE